MKLTAARLDALVWSFIYGGLIAAGIGIALTRSGESYGAAVIVAGALLAVIGGFLVWVRSRLPVPSSSETP